MENNQIIRETESALEAIALQETRQIEQNEEEQNEIFHDSLSEAQLRQQLDDPDSGSQIQGNMTEGGSGQNPPTHTDYEKSKHPQPLQNAETRTVPRVRRELLNLGSYNDQLSIR